MSPFIDKFNRYHGQYRRSGIQNLFIFVGCIIQGKTVNLYDLRDEVGKITEKHKSKAESHYKRLTRFLVSFSLGGLWASILGFGISLLKLSAKHCYLDATEWSIGKFNVHVLVLAFDYQGVAIPMYFQIYAHKGVLSQKERIMFMQNAIEYVSLKDKIVVADREFIGHQWFTICGELGIDLVCRIRKEIYKDHLVGNRTYQMVQQRALKKGRASCLIQIGTQLFRLWMVKNARKDNTKEPLIYLLTSILNQANTPDLYRFRWRIECLFKHLKTNGYNLEDLRVTDLHKIRLLISLLVLAYILAIVMAMEARKMQPCRKKNYQNEKKYDAISIFKQGQSLLKQSFVSLKRFLDIIQFLNVAIKAPLPFNWAFVQ